MTPLHSAAPDAAAVIDPDLCELLTAADLARASDVHLSANTPPYMRIDGALVRASHEVWDRAKVDVALSSLLAPEQTATFELEHELDFGFAVPSGTRYRANFFRARGAPAAAFRAVPSVVPQLAELGLPPQVAQFAELPRGLVLVTGTTGAGKSTTLAALIDLINRTHERHIMTVEDPIEIVHTSVKSLVRQREVGRDTRSFAEALRRLLRQDPDVIMVSDLRDLESIEFALAAADTGHLVFATLHTQGAAQTIDRLIDVFDGRRQAQVRAQLASALKGVISQALLPRRDGGGRVAVAEVMFTTPAIANLIRDSKSYQIANIMMTRADDGMITMDQSLAKLVNAGVLDFDTAMTCVHDPDTFRQLVGRRIS